MPQRNPTTISPPEPTLLRRSPRVQQLNNNSRFRYNSHSPSIPQSKSSAAQSSTSHNTLPIVCCLKSPTGSDCTLINCVKTNGLKKGCGLSNGVVGIEGHRWSSRVLSLIDSNCGNRMKGLKGEDLQLSDRRILVDGLDKGCRFSGGVEGIVGLRRSPRIVSQIGSQALVVRACNGDHCEKSDGGLGGRRDLPETGMGRVKPGSGLRDEDGRVLRERALICAIGSPGTPVQAGERKASICETGSLKTRPTGVKSLCKYVNGGSKKRLMGSSLAAVSVGSDEMKEINVRAVNGKDEEGYDAGSRGVIHKTSRVNGRIRTCSGSEVNGIVEVQGLRRSPRLLDRKDSQLALIKTSDAKASQSTISGLNSRRAIVKVNSEKSRRTRHSIVVDFACEPAQVKTQICDGNVKPEASEVCCIYTNSCATPVSGKLNIQKKDDNMKVTGVKRKRKQVDRIDQGWTKEQTSALHRAYFETKPTPHFWKKVAKKVPGKSAQDCFDKVNSEKLTPTLPPPHPRAKAHVPLLERKHISPGFSYSPCKIFRFLEPKNKRARTVKRKSHITQKAARHLLQKYSDACISGEVDLFSVLEPNVNLTNEAVQHTPSLALRVIGNLGSSPTRVQSSSSSHKKPLSRFSAAHETPLVSPPVLKPIKNRALHEKYIDHLHCRDAKRSAAATRNVKCSRIKSLIQGNLGNGDNVGTARSALVSDARDAISRFQHSQVNLIEDSLGSEEDFKDEDDEGETMCVDSSLFSPLRTYRL